MGSDYLDRGGLCEAAENTGRDVSEIGPTFEKSTFVLATSVVPPEVEVCSGLK